MGLKILYDGITPKLDKAKKKSVKIPPEKIKKLLRYGKLRAKRYARGNTKTHKLEEGIFTRYYSKQGKGGLYSVAHSPSGYPYNLWVNQDIVIQDPSRKYFGNGSNILYGQTGLKSPSGKPIQWRVTPRFFTRAKRDMNKKFKRISKNLTKEILY